MKDEHLQEKNKRIRLILRTPLVQTYEFTFPNRNTVTLSIVCIKDVEVSIAQGKIKSSQIHIEQIDDQLSWLQFLSMRKQLSLIGAAQNIDNTIFYGFDAIKCTSGSKRYGIISHQITSSLSSFVNQTVLKHYERQRIVNQYKHIMNDLQQHQIIFTDNPNVGFLRVGQKCKPLIRVTPQFQIYPINPNHFCFHCQKTNPFQKNIKLMQNLLIQIFKTSQQQENTFIFTTKELNQINKILNIASFISEINTKSFTQVQNIHTYKELLENTYFLKDLYKHYCLQGSISQLSKIIELIKVNLSKSYQIKQIVQLDKFISMQIAAKLEDKKYQTASKTYSQSLKKLYYNPLKIHQTQKSTIFVSTADIYRQISKIKPVNKKSKCQYHFLKAKQAWLNLNFTRSLAHLKKCLHYSSSLKCRSKIHLQIGRIQSHLCNHQNCERQYLTALQIIQRIQGSQSLSILSVLQNLIILYSKMGNIKKASQIHFRCESIKKRFKYNHLRLMPQLVHSLVIPILYGININPESSFPKQSKTISKQQALKIQIQRIPCLQKYWQILRPYLQKTDKEFNRVIELSEHLFQFGQFNVLYFIIKLIHNYQNNIIFSQRQQVCLHQAIQTAKNSDIRMYYRLIFLLSFYYEEQNKLNQSINLLKILYSSSSYSLVLINNFRKRMLELAKKGQIDQQIQIIYSDVEWLNNEGMMQQLYNSALYFQNQKEHMKCIKACKQYLQSIKNYSNPQEVFNKNAKIINRFNSAQVTMIKSMIQLQLFSQSQSLLKAINAQGKIDKNQSCILACQFCIKAFKSDEYWFCIQTFSTLIDDGTLIHLQQQFIKDVWLSVVRSHLNAQIDFGRKVQQIINIYERLQNFKQQIKKIIKMIKSEQPPTMNVLWRTMFYQKIGVFQTKINESDLKRTFQSQYTKLCQNFTIEGSISIFTLFKQHIQQINQPQKDSLIENIIKSIQRISHRKGKISQLTVCLHIYLYQIISSMQLYKQQILILLWFSSLSSKLIMLWDQMLWGGRQGRQLLLDRLLFQLFTQSLQPFQLKIDKLWWISSKTKDLLKLWKAYRHIIQSNNPSEEDAITFRILYGSYYSEQECESALLKEVSDKVGIISDQL